MDSPKLILGYSPYGAPYESGNQIYPFEEIWDEGKNLETATDADIDKCHALVLWGGSDISPTLYGEAREFNSGPTDPTPRDLFEWELLRRFSDKGKPIIGVCRGAQLLCAFAGGKLVQHVYSHGSDHTITTSDDHEFIVSSSHHQMMYPYDVEHELLAWSTRPQSTVYLPRDKQYSIELEQRRKKEPEVVWFPEINGLAIQCHPEWHYKSGKKWEFNEWMFNVILERFFD